MKNEDKTQIMLDESPVVAQSIDESRRSFSKRGLIAPVILTLANRSAWGANACIGSGFQSYAAAKADGRVISHAAVNSDTNTGWKKPRQNLPATPGDGWYEAYQTWPKGLIPVRRNGTANEYEVFTAGAWKKRNNGQFYTRNQVRSTFSGDKAFIDQLITGGSAVNTIYDVLGGTVGGNLLAYQVASEINKSYVDNSSTPFPVLVTLDDFRLFYRECVN